MIQYKDILQVIIAVMLQYAGSINESRYLIVLLFTDCILNQL